MRPVRCVVACAAVMFAFGVGGCTSGYSARVENRSGRVVRAEMVHNPFLGEPRALGASTLRPGEVAELGPADAPLLDPVEIHIRVSGSHPGDVPDKLRLDYGRNEVMVEPGDLETWSPVRVRFVDARERPAEAGTAGEGAGAGR